MVFLCSVPPYNICELNVHTDSAGGEIKFPEPDNGSRSSRNDKGKRKNVKSQRLFWSAVIHHRFRQVGNVVVGLPLILE